MKKTVHICDSCGKAYDDDIPSMLVPTGDVQCGGSPSNEKFKVCELLDLCHPCAVRVLGDVLDTVLYSFDELTMGVQHDVRLLLPSASTGVVLGGRA